jgi:hypothetical protein
MRKKISLSVMLILLCSIALAQKIKRNQIIVYHRWNGLFGTTWLPDYHFSNFTIGGQNVESGSRSQETYFGFIKRPRDIRAGLNFTLYKPMSFIGAFLDIEFVNKGFRALDTDFTTHSVVPTLALKIRSTADYTKSNAFFLVGGASYNYPFMYKAEGALPDNDINGVEKGWTGVVGIGYERIPGRRNEVRENRNSVTVDYASKDAYFSISILYHRDLYNFFNQSYVVDGVQPYQNWQANLGAVSIRAVVRGSMVLVKRW